VTDSDPVIVLTYAHAGAEKLTDLLSASPELACTSASGLLPLCHTLAATWQNVEGRNSKPSALAITSIRTVASAMAATIQARTGASRWCETACAPSVAAETFLKIFPTAKFLCLHRCLQAVLSEAAAIYPWGLGGSPFWPYSGSHPGNNAATVAAYWIAWTEPLLEFEAAHPRSCLRIRREDLDANVDRQTSKIFTHLGLSSPHQALRSGQHSALAMTTTAADGPRLNVPMAQIAPYMLSKADNLLGTLGYPLLDASPQAQQT
jgi:hypothetical protein